MFLKSSLKKTVLILSVTALTACSSANSSRQDKLAAGAMAGAVAGAVIGYNLIGAGSGKYIGALMFGAAGAYAGFYATDHLSRFDKSAMEGAAFEALSQDGSHETVTWANPDNGNAGSYTPLRTFLDPDGRICRDFRATLTANGQKKEEMQTACQLHNGNWIFM